MNTGSFWGALVIIAAAVLTFNLGDARDGADREQAAHATEAHGHGDDGHHAEEAEAHEGHGHH